MERRPSPDPATEAVRRPRILLLIKLLRRGGAEQLLVDVAANRTDEAFDYEVASIWGGNNDLIPAVEVSGVPVHVLGARGNADLRWLPALRRLLMAGDYDLVHFHLPYTAALGRLVVLTMPRRRRPVLVYTEHSNWGETSLVVRALNRFTISRDRALIAVSSSAFDALPVSLQRRATVVVHGTDLQRATEMLDQRATVRDEVRAELGVVEGELLILTVANLRVEKAYEVLLEAARGVIDTGVAVRFAAAGSGPHEAQVRALHKSFGLGDHFLFLGARSDVLRLLAAADIFVLASHYEGLPVSVMEATSLGLAIVTTGVGEIPNFLTDGVDARIVPPGQPAALADAIVEVAADASLRERLGQGALLRSAIFDVGRAAREIEAVYAELLDGAA